jgi:hypothetical protein
MTSAMLEKEVKLGAGPAFHLPNLEGVVFSWNYQPTNKACVGASLEGHPDNVAALKIENGRPFSTSATSGTKTGGSPGGPPSTLLLLAGLVFVVVACAAAVTVIRLRERAR